MEFAGNSTPVAPADMASALVRAYSQRFGHPPDRETATLLLALLFLEHDHGRAVIEHNWGNVSTKAGPDVDYWLPPWVDLEKVEARDDDDPRKARYLQLHQAMLDGKAPSAFRAFRDDESGLAVFFGTVAPSMYAAAATGDPEAFANAYWSSGYCPDQACKDSAPSFKKLQAEIRSAGYFTNLAAPSSSNATVPRSSSSAPGKKKVPAVGLWFWAWGQLLRLRTSSRDRRDGAAQFLTGEQP